MNLNNFLSNRFFTWILNRMEADADPVSGYALQRSIQFHFIAAISICSDILFRKEKEKAVLLLPRNDKVWRGCTIRLNPTVSPELYGDTRHLLDCQASLMVLEDCVEESGGEGGELPLLQLPSTAEEAVNSGWATRLIHVNKEDGMSKEATTAGPRRNVPNISARCAVGISPPTRACWFTFERNIHQKGETARRLNCASCIPVACVAKSLPVRKRSSAT